MTTDVKIDYEKRKNTELFSRFHDLEELSFSHIQNYIPIYNKFFSLNETNYNSVNLNNTLYIHDIKENSEFSENIFKCVLKNVENDTLVEKEVFFKFAPLLDPFKFLTGKYNIADEGLYKIPTLNSTASDVNPKLIDENNSAYVDSIFSFLTSKLMYKYNFIHGIDFYGSFLGIKKDFKLNIYDDLEYLCKCDFFNKHKNIDFTVEDYSSIFDEEESRKKLTPLNIMHNGSNKSLLSVQSIDDSMFENVFSSEVMEQSGMVEQTLDIAEVFPQNNIFSLNDLREEDLMDMGESLDFKNMTDAKTTTIKSSSTCSSRTSHTSDQGKSILNDDTNYSSGSEMEGSELEEGEHSDMDEYSDEEDDEDELVEATIPRFPVNVICMEFCENTLDSLMMENQLTDEEWLSALMQVIMTLIVYQKCFSFTHNDLHTNNIMYNTTEKKFIHYCYKNKYYKVPTFGRIYKIIDFGRAIYKFDTKLFCSDSFQHGSDASTQYNTEPYFNEKKPRLEPNYSFDLCRLACSLFDYFIDDYDDLKNIEKRSPVIRIIVDWCKDDNRMNILYKTNGSERYPDFKLYKMIARGVHNHTPQAQLSRHEFSNYIITKKQISKHAKIINIDAMPSFL